MASSVVVAPGTVVDSGVVELSVVCPVVLVSNVVAVVEGSNVVDSFADVVSTKVVDSGVETERVV